MSAWRKLRALGAEPDALRIALRCADEREAWSKLPVVTQAQLAGIRGGALVRVAARAVGNRELIAALANEDRATIERLAHSDAPEVLRWAAHAVLAHLDGATDDAEAAARLALRSMHPPVSTSLLVPCPFDAAPRVVPSLPTLAALYEHGIDRFAIVSPHETDPAEARLVIAPLHRALEHAAQLGRFARIEVTLTPHGFVATDHERVHFNGTHETFAALADAV